MGFGGGGWGPGNLDNLNDLNMEGPSGFKLFNSLGPRKPLPSI